MPRTEWLLLAIWMLLPPALLLLLNGNFLLSTVLYFVVPGLYFSYRVPHVVPRALVVAALSIPLVFVLDYLAFYNHAWTVPTLFHFRVLTLIPFEDFVFTFCATYLIVIGYGFFFHPRSYARINWLRAASVTTVELLVLGAFFALLAFHPSLPHIPFFYAMLVVFLFVPLALFVLLHYPAYRKPLLEIFPFAFGTMLLYELTALQLGFWSFPAHEYLGMISIGHLSFPLEELIAWMILFPATSLGFSELLTGFARRN